MWKYWSLCCDIKYQDEQVILLAVSGTPNLFFFLLIRDVNYLGVG